MLTLRIPPLLLTLIFACVMIAAAMATPALSLDAPALRWAGTAIILAGLAVCAGGVLAFRRAGTTVDPTRPDKASALVRSGIYRFTRNPMYLGFLLLLVGLGVLLGHPAALIIALAFVPYMNRLQIEPEEEALARLFGEEFARFKREVRRWL
jgi:protein-S-isoprenylcysteine O-methyltransferase Ste14